MKRLLILLLTLLCALCLIGCAGTNTGAGESICAYIAADVTTVEITHHLSGQIVRWTAEGDELSALRDWAAALECMPERFETGNTPGDCDGGEVYGFALTEGDYPGFSYTVNGPDDCHLLIEGQWYSVSNPSVPPVEGP